MAAAHGFPLRGLTRHEALRHYLTKRNAKMLNLLYRSWVIIGNRNDWGNERPSLLASEFDRKVIVANYRCNIDLEKKIEHMKREYQDHVQEINFAKRQYQRKQELLAKRKKDILQYRSQTPLPQRHVSETIEKLPGQTRVPQRPKSAPLRDESGSILSYVTPKAISPHPPKVHVRSMSAAERRLSLQSRNYKRFASSRPRRSLPVATSLAWDGELV